MVETVPERIAWAVSQLSVGPADHLLEIGCGPGVAAALITEHLVTGTITAIDRSPTAIQRARQRNRAAIAAGRASFQQVTLEGADLGTTRYDKVFAVNVNLFWVRDATTELATVGRALAPGGTLHLFYEPPTLARGTAIADRVAPFLAAHGFTVTTATAETRRGTPLLGLRATPVPP